MISTCDPTPYYDQHQLCTCDCSVSRRQKANAQEQTSTSTSTCTRTQHTTANSASMPPVVHAHADTSTNNNLPSHEQSDRTHTLNHTWKRTKSTDLNITRTNKINPLSKRQAYKRERIVKANDSTSFIRTCMI